MTQHVVMFSGGIGSWAAAKRVAEAHGTDSLTLLFTDTLIEDSDLYRFLDEAAANVGGQLIRLVEGRTIWEVFRDERFLGNHLVDPCSKILKRQMADRWFAANCVPSETVIYVGIDWTEEHRFTRLRDRRGEQGWTYRAPLCDAPYLSKENLFELLANEGILAPRLYRLGFAHNNCGGGCVKAGMGHFAHLLKMLPDVFTEWEKNEAELRATLGPAATILTDRRGGKRRPLPLTELRERVETGDFVDRYEIGGCGCFVDTGVP